MSEYERLKKQKDEILARQRTSETELWHHWHERWQEVSKELNNQKSITELAIKGLKDIESSQYVISSKALTIARSTLSEIERLTHEN